MKRMHISKFWIAAILAALLCLCTGALAVSSYTYTIENNVVTITGYTGTEAQVEIPATIMGSPVTAIGEKAFYNCDSITSVTIPAGVESIGNYAFYYCNSLTDITIPSSVKSIGNYAFCHCIGLTSLAIPDGVVSIGWDAFNDCSSLASITIPDSVKSIGSGAFYDCTKLKDVYAQSLEGWLGISFSSGSYTKYCNPLCYGARLYFNNQLATNITVPGGINAISECAFAGCTSLTGIVIPDSVSSIGEYAFSDCTNLTSVTLPKNLTEIEYRLFSGCGKLTGVTIPSSVTGIGDYAFSRCSALQSIVLPKGTKSIGDYAFYLCGKLSSITIPHTVTDIGEYFLLSTSRNLEVSCHQDSPIHAYIVKENASNALDYGLRVERHTNEELGGEEPGCDSEGYTDYVCTVCGYEHTEYEGALGHDYQVSASREADCDEAGFTTYTCSRCGDTYTDEHESLGHDHQISASKEADCDEAGFTTYTCTRCGDTYTENHWQLGHNYVDGICSRCGEYKPIPSLPDGFHQEILNTGHVVSLPRGSYLDTERSTSTMECWVTPEKLIVVFARQNMYAPVQDWATAMQPMYGTKYTSLNEIPVAFGTTYESSKGYLGACGFNSGGYSYLVYSEQMTSSQKSLFESICNTLYNGPVPEKKPFKQEILGSGITVYLPGDAYLYSTDADGNQYWSSPKQNLMIGFSKNQLAPLEAWKAVCESDFVYCEIETIGNTRVLVCDDVDENERCISHCYVNGLDATYSITSVDMTIDQYAWFQVNVTNTIEANFNAGSVIRLPSALKEIRQEAFAFCNAEIVMIPEGCQMISVKAFYGSDALKRVDIPASVTMIYPDAFDGCDNLTIYAPAGSEAITFAKNHSIPYVEK